MKYLSNLYKSLNTAQISFPFITICYFLFVLILNLVVKYKYNKIVFKEKDELWSYEIPEFFKILYDNNLGFLIPVINTLGAVGIINNKEHSTTPSIIYAFFSIIVYSSIIEYKIGHLALILFMFNAILYRYYVSITNKIQLNDPKIINTTYPGNILNPINVYFDKYSCCGSAVYTNLHACALVSLLFTTKTILYKVIILILTIMCLFIYFIYDYYSFKDDEFYKDKSNIIIIRSAFSWHFLMYLFGLISSVLFFIIKLN